MWPLVRSVPTINGLRVASVLLGAWVTTGSVHAQPATSSTAAEPTAVPAVAVEEAICLAPSAPVFQCTGNRTRPTRNNSPPSHVRVTDNRSKAEGNAGPTGPSIEFDTAAWARHSSQARAWELLQREVQVLERLVRNTAAADDRRPEILLRLADTYFEMQVALKGTVRSFDEPMYAARQQGDKKRVAELKQRQDRAEAQLDDTRRKTVRTYAQLVEGYPEFPKIDQVLFALAFSVEELGERDSARQVYFRLINNHPNSPYVPHAYLSFAEYYFARGDMGDALQFYNKVLEYPPENNAVYGFALYKSAWAHFNVQAFKDSLRTFVQVIEFATANPDANDATNLARQSRREMVMPYAMFGRPSQALGFFRRYAGSNELALDVFESLGELYVDTGKWNEAIEVYRELIAEEPASPKLCRWQAQIALAHMPEKSKREQRVEAEQLARVFHQFAERPSSPADEVQICGQKSATLLFELATSWHREAVGTKEHPGTRNPLTMQLASELYGVLLEHFPTLDNMQFPALDRRDWPSRYKVSYYAAELLWKQGDWLHCGPAFDRVVEENPNGEYTNDAAYAAVLCYNNLYDQQYAARERRRSSEQASGQQASFAPREFTETEQGMLRAFDRYICFVSESKELPKIKYRRARIYYEANHFDQAAHLFKDIAFQHRDSDLASFAANLYLDSLNVLSEKVEQPRPQCLFEMKENIDPLWAAYCGDGAAGDSSGQLCPVLEQVRCDVTRKVAETQEKKKQFKEAARTYVQIARQYRGCGQLDEVLFNAAINFEAARLLGRSIQVRKVLIDRFSESPLAKRSIYLVGANYHALAIYSQAADYYERFAREVGSRRCASTDELPGGCAQAPDSLKTAVLFRIGLGEYDKAIEDIELFESLYKRTFPRDTAQVMFSLGTVYKRQRNLTDLVKHYREYVKVYRRSALPHLLVKAHVEIGNAFRETNNGDRAAAAFSDAVRTWSRGMERRIQTVPDSTEEERAKWMLEAKDAVSEALFYLAEVKFEDFQAIRFPRYRGRGTLRSVNNWAKDDFSPWIAKKQKALVAAQKAFEKIAELEVPRWEIAAASRVGQMWHSFVNEFRDAPIPNEIEEVPELFDVYVGTLDEKSEPFQRQAIDKFEFCMIVATRVRWFSEYSQTCETALNQLNPREYPLANELRGVPTYIRSEPSMPGPVLELEQTEDEDDLSGAEGTNAEANP